MRSVLEASNPSRRDDAPIVIAPFANEIMREWPLDRFQRFIEIGLEDGRRFVICGTLEHRALANKLVRPFRTGLVENCSGSTSWPQVQKMLMAAPFVVANNSGIAHLAAALGRWVLCIFGGRHSWREWMPRGARVVTIARTPPCSPCESPTCPNDLACLKDVDPLMAYLEITMAIERDRTQTVKAEAAMNNRT